VLLIVSLLATAAVTDDSIPAANRASARQLRQVDISYPGSVLSSVHGSATKRITAGVKAAAGLTAKFDPATGLHPPARISVERKKNDRILRATPTRSLMRLAGF
jgi:hypothetical protein